MRIGVTIHATDKAMSPVEVAREAEARGFYSLYIPEHTHIPTSRRTPPPTGRRGARRGVPAQPRSLRRAGGGGLGDLFGSAWARGSGCRPSTTPSPSPSSSRPSTGSPAAAWSSASASAGTAEEMENHGIDVKRRRSAGAREDARHAGALVERGGGVPRRVRRASSRAGSGPSRCSSRVPRVLIGGGAGPKLFAHIAEYADGWMPIGGAGMKAPCGSGPGHGGAGPRPEEPPRRSHGRRAQTRRSSPTTPRTGSPRWCCACPRRPATR